MESFPYGCLGWANAHRLMMIPQISQIFNMQYNKYLKIQYNKYLKIDLQKFLFSDYCFVWSLEFSLFFRSIHHHFCQSVVNVFQFFTKIFRIMVDGIMIQNRIQFVGEKSQIFREAVVASHD